VSDPLEPTTVLALRHPTTGSDLTVNNQRPERIEGDPCRSDPLLVAGACVADALLICRKNASTGASA
jgi:hypothetical protein